MDKAHTHIIDTNRTIFVDVLLPVPIPKYFTYRVPMELNDFVAVGHRVIVQFGRRKVLTGVVAQMHHQPPKEYEAKYIIELLDDAPYMNQFQLDLFTWMARYYMCTIGEVFNVAMPAGLKLSSESKIQLNPNFDMYESEYEFSDKEEAVILALTTRQTLSYDEVEGVIQAKTYLPVLKSLIAKEAILIYEEIKDRYKPKVEKRVRLVDQYHTDEAINALFSELEKKQGQVEVLMLYLRQVPFLDNPELRKTGIKKADLTKGGASASSINTLIKNRVLDEFEVVIPRFDFQGRVEALKTLSQEQKTAIDQIHETFKEKQTILLHGVTGSGKTELYIHLINEILEQDGQVLYLLPEIALTTQIVARLRKVFGKKLGVYHSKFSDNERVEVWRGLITGTYSVIVGVRSSIFLPFDNLNLIIVDEEHETSYKQYDPAPRYNARDAVQMLARLHFSKVLMGTATPSVETYFNYLSGLYGYVRLENRYGTAKLPDVVVANIAAERKSGKLKGDFTETMINHIASALHKKEQVIIFQNRRGYSHYLSCEECGWVPECQNCSVSLTYHIYDNNVRCHYCGYRQETPVVCPACGSRKIKTVGLGTEKLEDDLKILFPNTNIARMDLDTTRNKNSYEQIITDFEKQKIDILVGTQMISKGLDFDHVSMVGIFDVDRMLHFPDFRSNERAYHLINQVSGRAGRKEKEGLVVMQSGNPNQPILSIIIRQQYDKFLNLELQDRQEFKYPPFYRLIKIIIRHTDQQVCLKGAYKLGEIIDAKLVGAVVLPPHEPMIARMRGKYLMEILIKVKRNSGKLEIIKEKLQDYAFNLQNVKDFKQLDVIFDVDPI